VWELGRLGRLRIRGEHRWDGRRGIGGYAVAGIKIEDGGADLVGDAGKVAAAVMGVVFPVSGEILDLAALSGGGVPEGHFVVF